MRGDDPATAETALGATERRQARGVLPREIGRYLLTSPLGAGGMGQVYRARDPQLNREVAIKLLHRIDDGTAAGRVLELRLLREAQAMARLSHPNLAVVHDVGSDRGEVFLAMELIEGETLKSWLAQPRPWRARLDALLAAGRGLAAAHAAGLIHRDFKPDNVLVARDGAVKVVDFGLARGVGELEITAPESSRDDVLQSPMTLTGTVMGTPAYMAPEQHAGEPADERADQFGFAVSVYEALYRRRPFAGNGLALSAEVFAGAVPPPPDDSDVPAALFEVVRRGLAQAPADRHPSIVAMIDALEQAATPPAPRPRWVAAVGVIGFIGVAAIAFTLLGRNARSGKAPPPPLSSEQVAAVVREHLDAVKQCHAEALRGDAALPAGTVAITFSIDAGGAVTSTRIEDGALSRGLATCVAAASLRWQFPAPGTPVTVTYPFEFATYPAPQVEAAGDDVYRIPRAQVDAWLADPWPLTVVRPVPSKKDNLDAGLKLYAISEGSALAALGFENGDTLIGLDELVINDEGSLMLSYATLSERLRTATQLTATVRRRGDSRVLTYQIVGAPTAGAR